MSKAIIRPIKRIPPPAIVILLYALAFPIIFNLVFESWINYALLPSLKPLIWVLLGVLFSGVSNAGLWLLTPKENRFPLWRMSIITLLWIFAFYRLMNWHTLSDGLLILSVPLITLMLMQSLAQVMAIIASWGVLPIALIFALMFSRFDAVVALSLSGLLIGLFSGLLLVSGLQEELELEESRIAAQKVPRGQVMIGDDGEIVAIDEGKLNAKDKTVSTTYR